MLGWALAIWTLAGGELRWQAPQECPSAEAVRAQFDAAGGLGELEVDAVITEGPSAGWTLALTIALDDVSDKRTLHDENCDALAEAAVLLVATRLDPKRSEPPLAPVEPPTPIPEAPANPPPARHEPEPTQTQPEAPVDVGPPPMQAVSRPPAFALPTGLSFAVAAGLSLGSVPLPGVPSELAVGYAWQNLRASVRGRVHVGPQRRLDGGGSIRVVLGSVGPQVCARPRWRRLEFPLCGDLGVGGSRAVTRGTAQDRAGTWVEAGLAGGVAWFVAPRWALTAQLAGSSPLVGSRYALDGDIRWDPSPVAGRAMLGVEFLVPIQIRSRPEKSQ